MKQCVFTYYTRILYCKKLCHVYSKSGVTELIWGVAWLSGERASCLPISSVYKYATREKLHQHEP
jgi:hypothetical protein